MSLTKTAKRGAYAQPLYKASSVQLEELGTPYETNDGRLFVYARAGGTALAVGKINIAAATVATSTDETIAASGAIGAEYVSVTFGGAVTADYYKEGYLHINDDTGEGYVYRVKGHPAGTTAVQVDLDEPVRAAFTAGASTASVTKHPQDGVVVLPAATAASVGILTGVAPIAVTANYYFWHQVKGPAAVLVHGTVVIGNEVYADWTASTGVAGACIPVSTLAMQIIGGRVGTCIKVNADTEYALVMLSIPGY